MKLQEAPFEIGDKLKYIGESITNQAPLGIFPAKDSDYKPLTYPSIIVTVINKKPPMPGLGWQEDDNGEKWFDYGDHGYNVWENEYGLQACIDVDNMYEWELVQ